MYKNVHIMKYEVFLDFIRSVTKYFYNFKLYIKV